MYRKFLNARSPLRLLEKGLHGGLGIGNLGACVAGHGVGKSSFLVGVAIDELLRGGTVLHVTLDQTVAHARNFYDTVWEAFATTKQIDDPVLTHAEIDKNRRIRAYRAADFNAIKLADAVKVESEADARPTLIVIDGLSTQGLERDDLAGIRALAQELAAEVWFTVQGDSEKPDATLLADYDDLLSVILCLEPNGSEVTLRALKDHDSDDLQELHVGLDPTTLLLTRS